MPTRVQRRADVAAIMTRLTGHICLGEQVQQGLKRIRVAKQIAVLCCFGDAVVDAGQTAGDRADDTARAQRPDEVLEE